MKIVRTLAGVITCIFFILGSNSHSGMIADITHSIETDFGIYHPYPAIFSPSVPQYSLEPDLSNIDFSGISGFTFQDSLFLYQNHFTVRKSRFTQLFDVYNACTWNGTPLFVTTDAVLHTYHVLFDRILSDTEVHHFTEMVRLLTDTLIEEMKSVLSLSDKSQTYEAVRRNLAYVSVAKKLLDGEDASIPASVSTLVDSELVLINAADGFHYSPILGNFSKLDYSQFKPRGHYTTSDTLSAYFRAMMWYGWAIFTMEQGLFGDLAHRHTLQAIILVQALYRCEAEGKTLIDVWDDIYKTTVFFVGRTDDPNVEDYYKIAMDKYGENFLSLMPDSLADSRLLNEFMVEAQKLPEPKIPNWIYGVVVPYKGFRFMGQRFIPDSYMFAHLVFPEVDNRLFPKGLDVMAILGSERAYTLLDSFYHETSYTNYPGKITDFRAEFVSKTPTDWAQNLYWNWLYCLMPLLYEKGDGYPFFMSTEAWANKELLTALASWAELRHDTILYAKQSSTPRGGGSLAPKSYVEPNPFLYTRLASLVRYTREGLASRGLLDQSFHEKLDIFEHLLLFLSDVSIKELENVPLSDIEYKNIFCFGKVMQSLVSTGIEKTYKADDMAVVADVHTDHNTDQCLEEGVGYPLEIYIIVNEGGTIHLTRGAMLSYYEFIVPIEDRLTDEAWREILTGETLPAMPEWTENFLNTASQSQTMISSHPKNLYSGEFVGIDMPDNAIPAEIRLRQNYPNPFNPETTIRFEVPCDAHVSLTVYNIIGQEVVILRNGFTKAGSHTLKWDGRDSSGRALASGIYLCKMEMENFTEVKLMLLLR